MARHCEFRTPDEAYLGTLQEVYHRPDYITSPRGQRTREVVDYSFTVALPSSKPIETPDAERNAVIRKYTEGEFRLYEIGERRATEFAKIAPFWGGLGDDQGNVGSCYGYKIWYERNTKCGMTQWEWCYNRLAKDKDTRQAVLLFGTPKSQYPENKDQACTLHGLFLYRGGRLHLHMSMRSNDVVRGLCYDMPWFCLLLERMCAATGMAMGEYHHFAHSMHFYDSTLQRAERMMTGGA